MKFECLPNEILLICFEYFDVWDLFESFDRLNLVPAHRRDVAGQVLFVQGGEVVGVIVVLLRRESPAHGQASQAHQVGQWDQQKAEWNDQDSSKRRVSKESAASHGCIIRFSRADGRYNPDASAGV